MSKCKGCENGPEQTDKCKKWIRQDHSIKAIPETLIEKNNNRINVIQEQLLENRTIEEWIREEHKLVGLKQVEEPGIELIKK